MCLVINNHCHHACSEGYCIKFEPLIAKIPLTVYKVLNYAEGILQTPFRETRINFITDEVVMSAPMMDYYQKGWCVDIGIHALENTAGARAALKIWSHRNITLNLVIYKAIIPVGTKYFCGMSNAIVSEKLIIKNKIVK